MLTHLRAEHLVNDEIRSIIDEKAPGVIIDDAWYYRVFFRGLQKARYQGGPGFRADFMFRAFTFSGLTKFSIAFVVAMNLAGQEKLTGLSAGIAAGALVLGALLHHMRILPPGRKRQDWRHAILTHRAALTKRYRQLVRVNAYGAEEFDKWHAELERFRASIRLQLAPADAEAFDALATRMVSVWAASNEPELATPPMQEMSPLEYEHHCADLLARAGWEVEVTGGSGDQGIDILARRNRVVVAVQCKLYFSNPVGNKAVQEAHAASGFVDADFAAVVSNREFTSSAEQLARKLGVFLLHHSELQDLAAVLDDEG